MSVGKNPLNALVRICSEMIKVITILQVASKTQHFFQPQVTL